MYISIYIYMYIYIYTQWYIIVWDCIHIIKLIQKILPLAISHTLHEQWQRRSPHPYWRRLVEGQATHMRVSPRSHTKAYPHGQTSVVAMRSTWLSPISMDWLKGKPPETMDFPTRHGGVLSNFPPIHCCSAGRRWLLRFVNDDWLKDLKDLQDLEDDWGNQRSSQPPLEVPWDWTWFFEKRRMCSKI